MVFSEFFKKQKWKVQEAVFAFILLLLFSPTSKELMIPSWRYATKLFGLCIDLWEMPDLDPKVLIKIAM